MNNSVVVYQSKYGYTMQYASWIANGLSCDAIERKNIDATALEKYDTIIYGCGIYHGEFSGIELITKAFEKLSDKKLIIFTCGLYDPEDKKNAEDIKKNLGKVLTADMLEKIRLFHLRGGIDYSRLSFPHRMTMAAMKKKLMNKAELTTEEKRLLNNYGKSMDFTNKTLVVPIVIAAC